MRTDEIQEQQKELGGGRVGGGSAKVLYVAKKSVRKMGFLWVVRCRMSEIKLMDANNKLN